MRTLSSLNSTSVAAKPVAAFVLGLVGGIFILLGSVVMFMFALGSPTTMMNGMGGMGMMTSMMGGMTMTWMMGFAPVLATLGFASGIMVTVGSVMFFRRPSENHLWGAIILAFSVVSVLGSMGGLLVGLILGMLGGILAITWSDTGKLAGQTSIALSTGA